jgi:hypothetical protein
MARLSHSGLCRLRNSSRICSCHCCLHRSGLCHSVRLKRFDTGHFAGLVTNDKGPHTCLVCASSSWCLLASLSS